MFPMKLKTGLGLTQIFVLNVADQWIFPGTDQTSLPRWESLKLISTAQLVFSVLVLTTHSLP